jgi:class 3 adenylate cyclase
MVKDGDIVGDGVNIAARLETLAEPGGICVSRGVRDHVRKMGQYAFQDLGEQTVKNICPTDPRLPRPQRGRSAARTTDRQPVSGAQLG